MKKNALYLLLPLLLSVSCFINKVEDKEVAINLQTGQKNIPLTITVIKGEHYTHIMKLVGPLKANILPQMVFWIQKPDGSFIDTIYITGAYAKPKGHAGKSSKGSTFWKECFPAWSARMASAGKKLPQDKDSNFDAVTSATPQSSYTINTALTSGNVPIVIFAEINKSADYNDVFTEENSDWIGQPSIIYSERISSTEKNNRYILKPIGYGDPDKQNGINPDFSDIDTALKIVQEIRVEF